MLVYPLVNKHSYGRSRFLMGKSTISMAIVNSYVSLPEGIPIMKPGFYHVPIHFQPLVGSQIPKQYRKRIKSRNLGIALIKSSYPPGQRLHNYGKIHRF